MKVGTDYLAIITGSDFFQHSSKSYLLFTKYYHFKVSSIRSGVGELNEFAHLPTEEVNILKVDVSIGSQETPEVIPPPGIPLERQKCLDEQIRECFVSQSMLTSHSTILINS